MKNGIFNRQSLLEVFLLVVFASGIFVSKIIVDYKSRIILGPGIQLASSGLTVHLPSQNGWRGLKEWQYERDNSFALPACLMGRSNPAVEILWKYNLTCASQNSRQVLEELAAKIGAEVSETQMTTGNCPMEYIQILPSHNEEQYIGAVLLDFGRVLILQVKGETTNPFLIKHLFLSLARNLNYDKPNELTEGVEFLERARILGADLFSSSPSKQYLIRDVSGNIRGHETIRTQMDSQQRLHISRQTFLATGVVDRRDHQFDSTGPLEQFNWLCQSRTDTRLLGTFCIEFKENEMMIIEDTAGQRRSVRLGPAIAGEILLDGLVRYFLEAEQQKITVDILYFDGQIVPTQIFLLPTEQAIGKTEGLAFAVRAESPNGLALEYYFNADKKLLGKITLEAPRKVLLWDSVEIGEMEKYFKDPPINKGPRAAGDAEKENFLLDVIKGRFI